MAVYCSTESLMNSLAFTYLEAASAEGDPASATGLVTENPYAVFTTEKTYILKMASNNSLPFFMLINFGVLMVQCRINNNVFYK